VNAIVKARTSEEIALDRIEQGSKCPWPRQASRPLFDPERLGLVFDPDEMLNEERICSHGSHLFRDVEDFSQHDSDGITEDDFRNEIDFVDCACVDGQSCICCCTKLDFELLDFRTKKLGEVIARSPTGAEMFDVFISREELEARGIL
jgi:hypothetical protein